MRTNRRHFIRNAGAGFAGITIGTSAFSMSSDKAVQNTVDKEDDQILLIGDDIALTDTQYGKVKGYMLRGINYFLGIPYGADTSGANRFMPPRKPTPWTTIFPAVYWPDSAPQSINRGNVNSYSYFSNHFTIEDLSEDCLRINVFTPAVNDGKKRPVMVWFHGGGFTQGNGLELGENFSRLGDVVFCTVNHRLGVFGFTNLAGVDSEKFAGSGNVGMIDLVAALEWVRDNITNFGGDPGNVTIMGHSGGGAKVITLTSMPAAKGLFHKAVALSAGGMVQKEKEYSEKLGKAILEEAGLSPDQIGKLQEMPWEDYLSLANRAASKLNASQGASARGRFTFSPVADGANVLQHPYLPEACPLAAEVPLIICTTTNEMNQNRYDTAMLSMSLDEVKAKLKQSYGEKTSAIVDAYAKAFPSKKPVQIWGLAARPRNEAIALANAKSKQQAPVFLAWYDWQSPLFDYCMRPFHGCDVSFWLYNTDVILHHSGGGSRPRKLAEKMAKSLIQFMKTGDPNGGGLPQWPEYTSEKGETMILNDLSEVKNDPDRDARKTFTVS
jgi:para-nitrobenzyl esterase